MSKCRKANKLVCIGIVVILFAACGSAVEPKGAYRAGFEQKGAEIYLTAKQTGAVLGDVRKKVKAELTEISKNAEEAKRLSYSVKWEGHFNYPSSVYHIGDVKMQPYYVPVLLVEIPDDKQKEERINRMLSEHYVEVLPDAGEENWWRMQEIQITYRSERYLCFQYVSHTDLPEGCNYNDLYMTLDLEREELIPYPALEGQKGKYSPHDFGTLYQELEAYQEKTIAEQNLLRGEQSYEVQGITAECEGTFFPSVEIDGLEDKEKQERINGILQEPLRTLIMNEGWEDEGEKQALFDKTKIYIAYKSEEWLSVVYSIKVWNLNEKNYDGVADFGVTINLQSGERVMLDDLLEIDGLMTWMYACGRYKENDPCFPALGFLLTEEEVLTNGAQEGICYEGKEFAERYALQWDTFYLYEGKLVITGKMGLFDFEIPLPEIYGYLKVDPWYF